MTNPRLTLVNGSEAIRPIVLAAGQRALPGAEIIEAPTLDAAGAHAGDPAGHLLVLFEPGDTVTTAATQAVDAGGFPRWAVVVMGPGGSDLAETVPAEEWTPPALARIFRSALLQHGLMRETLRLRGDLKTLARRIRHDLRTPAGCIHTSADLLLELPPGNRSELVGLAGIFRQCSGEISDLVDRVGFLLRASAEPAPATPVDMGAVVASALRLLEPEIRRAGAVIRQSDSWPEVTGVAASLQVIWWNLVDNALKHGGPTAQVELAWGQANGGHWFSVTDHGPGVTPSLQAGLFSPFDQLHARRAPGLGLSIVQRLVTLHGGRCGHEKPDGTGARFHFTLP